jgi:hypothetical protein
VMNDRREWEQATSEQRRRALAADSELPRRHPDQRVEPLRSAEPEPVSAAEATSTRLVPGQFIADDGRWLADLAVAREQFTRQLASQQARRAEHTELAHAVVGQAPGIHRYPRLGILQPPVPQIPPSARVLERAGIGLAQMEAAN